ncbi:hypothetical protein [Streptomyces sp. S.PNR 29]|uniref:hypothetical protein n=1 Tax=Streptomyces sp. S.PNR 29 TaxID=2973805 RepID=UPI0025B10CB0|nr:hypothetical protein [Streptomyces sp. S.PNR 29]MDN0197953.1 hypothetical protein [Streptomyces sp. S.PNR 29]
MSSDHHTPTDAGAAPTGTEALQQQLVQCLMDVIAAPDDAGTARAADDVLSALDARLTDGRAGSAAA